MQSEEVFRGRVFNVTRDEVCERADEIFVREIVTHSGSACILPLFSDNTIALVRQYRHPAREFLLEIPAGGRDGAGEPPEVCAHRELEEEIGMIAGRMELLAEFYPSPGFLAEKMWVYLATDMRETAQKLDDDEEVEIVRLSVAEATAMIARGEIKDAKTIIALLMLAERGNQTSNATES
jgi:ADP-ribose pyrophosphatase